MKSTLSGEHATYSIYVREVDRGEGEITRNWSGPQVVWRKRAKAAAGLDATGGLGVLHVEEVRDGLPSS